MTAPSPWILADRSGFETVCGGRAEWLAEWRHRVCAIEAADRPVDLRRAGLERMLTANASAFRALMEYGAFDAVLDVTAAICAADTRLSCLGSLMGEAA